MGLNVEEQQQLIEKFVKTNAKFNGNEDLLEDFCSEAFQKSYIMCKSNSSINKIESYLQKVVNTSIVTVLKDSGRLTRTHTGKYVKHTEVPLEETKVAEESPKAPIIKEISLPKEIGKSYSYEIEDPKIGIEETLIKKDLLQRIADAVCVVHSDNPGKCYLEIYQARYIRGLKQREISVLLNISQSEVSKRLLELSKLIKFRIDT
jgi:RNA polymerase sigma factor (sigma-70 family)